MAIGREDADREFTGAFHGVERLGSAEGHGIIQHRFVGLFRTAETGQKRHPDNEARDAGYRASSTRKVHAPSSTTASSVGLRFEQIAS